MGSNSEETMKKPVIKIIHEGEEQFAVFVDEITFGSFSHDEHGWVGMIAIETLLQDLALKLNIKLIDEYN